MFGDLLRRLFQNLHPKLERIVPEPRVSSADAIVIAKELALSNKIYWDDETASISLSSKEFSQPCWKVFTGTEPFGSGDDWASTGQIDSAHYLFIDAETGEFSGMGDLRHIVPAALISGKYFKLPEK